MMRRWTGLLMVAVGVLLVVGAAPAGAGSAGQPEQLSSPTASLTITKAVSPGSEGTGTLFSFGGSLGDFRLAEGESVTFAGLAPGSYAVVEILPAGWQLGGVTCLGVEGQVSPGDRSVTITLEQGQPAACTFVNYQEEVAGPELPNTGPPSFTLPLLVGGLWALLAGLALAVWSSLGGQGRA